MDKLKILFLAANPADTSRLKLDEEIRAIEQALRRGKYWNHFQLEQHWAVRVTDLQALLLESRPHIVHFSGHGSAESEIILQDEQGQSRPIPRQALKTLFELLKGNIHCVVLNSCYSKEQANSIAETIDCVVGMSDAIGDQAAIRFSSSFYQALAFGESVDKSFKLGCNQINLEDIKEEDKPKLITRRSDPSEIFLVYISEGQTDAADLPGRNTTKPGDKTDMAKVGRRNKYILVLLLISCILIGLVSYRVWLSLEPDFTLPKIPPALETNIGIADFNGCPSLQNRLVKLLDKTFNNSNPSVKIRQLSAANDKLIARKLGENTDLVIWGDCGAEEKIATVNFEIMSARGTPEIYEPESLEFMPSTDEQLDRIVKGVGFYVYRDIPRSQDIFNDMAEHDFKDSHLVKLMWGNSLMFGRNYEKAIAVYSDALDSFPQEACLYYNLGIASMNFLKKNGAQAGSYEKAKVLFTKALEIDPSFALAHVGIGLMNIIAISSSPSTDKKRLDLSITACKNGLFAGGRVESLAKYCLNEAQINLYLIEKWSGSAPTPVKLEYVNYQDGTYWNAPLIMQASADYLNWEENKNPVDLIHVKNKAGIALKKSVRDVHTEFTMERHYILDSNYNYDWFATRNNGN